MPRTVTARQGEAWDQVAYRLWGREKLMHLLLEANPIHRDKVFFDGGEVLLVPDVAVALQPPVAPGLPPWKRR